MAQKLKQRAKTPKVLSDLVGGDCCTLEHEKHGEVEVQIGFSIQDSVYVRVRDPRANQLICVSGDTPFLELTHTQPSSASRTNQILEEVDPVFGMSATNGEKLFKRRNKS
jgi:hypothetical protein